MADPDLPLLDPRYFGLGDLIAILFAGAVAKRISESPRMGQRLSQAGGVILIALGLRLAAERA